MHWPGPEPTINPEKQALFDFLDGNQPIQEIIAASADAFPEPNVFGSALRPPPAKIWLYWDQGWEEAPEIVKVCLASWRWANPDCEIFALDHATITDTYPTLSEAYEASGLAGFSDRVRLQLLASEGGIWADATTFCSSSIYPLMVTLTQLTEFFAYSYPAPDRIISSWLMSSARDGAVVTLWSKVIECYFEALQAEERKIHCYFWLHYSLEYLVRRCSLRNYFSRMPMVCVNAPSRLANMLQINAIDAPDEPVSEKVVTQAKRHLEINPIHKLTWKGAVRTQSLRAEQLLQLLEAHMKSHSSTGRVTP